MRNKRPRGIEWIIGARSALLVQVLVPLVFFGVLLIIWDLEGKENEFLYSRPTLVYEFILQNYRGLLYDAYVSAQHVTVGLLIGCTMGFFIGVHIASWRFVESGVVTTLGLVFAFPKLSVMLILVVWVGHTEDAVYLFNIWVALLISFLIGYRVSWQILTGTDASTRDRSHAATIYFKNRSNLLVRYVLPLSITHFYSSLLMSSAILWPTLIFSESVIAPSNPGLGNVVYSAGYLDIRMEALFAGSLLMMLCNLGTWGIIKTCEKLIPRIF